jgi:hypothetical protein
MPTSFWRRRVVGLVLMVFGCPGVLQASEIPYFARKYGVDCRTCHVQPPKLNAFGESFRLRGYRMPGLEARRTIPLAIWASGRSDAFHDEAEVREAVRAYVNKLEVISGGQLVVPWLTYFVEWRPVSFETQRRDGMVQLRDRSGRFEDIFVTASAGNLAVTLGQYRQIEQVDVSLRLGLSEPLPLSAGLAGSGGGSSRERALRSFSPAGRSPAARVGWQQPLGGGWSWTTMGTVPVPGEFSIPLTRDARVEASNEVEWRAKGVVLESFLQRGLDSYGGHAFYDHGERYLVQAVTSGRRSRFYWTGVGGLERLAGMSRGRWSAEGTYAPSHFVAVGGRVENRAGDGQPAALLPYVRLHLPGTQYTVYVSVEQRVQSDRNATLVELGTVF